jgi:hypothetical protein
LNERCRILLEEFIFKTSASTLGLFYKKDGILVKQCQYVSPKKIMDYDVKLLEQKNFIEFLVQNI